MSPNEPSTPKTPIKEHRAARVKANGLTTAVASGPRDPVLPGLDGYLKPPRASRDNKLKPVKVGSVVIPIYRFTDRWAIIYREAKGAPRKTLSFKTEAAARTEGEKLCIQIARGNLQADALTPDERAQAVAARNLLLPLGLALDTNAREVADAHALTGGAGIAEMARFWAKHHGSAENAVAVIEELHHQLLQSVQKQEHAPRWRQALEFDLKKFVDAFAGRSIRDITAAEIETWLGEQRGNWRTYNNRLRLVRQLFFFAQKKKVLPADRPTEPKTIEPLKRPRSAHQRIGVLAAKELGEVLEKVAPAWLPFVVLGAFAGLRRAEIERLQWSDIRWEEKIIQIRHEVAKITNRVAGDERFPPMSDQLLAWLRPWQHRRSGPVCLFTRWEDESRRLRLPLKSRAGQVKRAPLIDFQIPKNAFRHTFGSNRVSQTKNMPQVADEMGNSVSEIRRDYRNPRTEREVKAWACLLPVHPDNVIEWAKVEDEAAAKSAHKAATAAQVV